MAITIEIQVSTSGVSDSAFTTIATVADTGTTVYDHTPVDPGTLYIYRARRRDDSQDEGCQYSDWSALLFLRGAYPLREIGMSCEIEPITGQKTALYLGLESCQGIPHKAQWGAEYISGNINRDVQKVFSRALRNAPAMRRKVVMGKVMWEGSFEVEITPEGPFMLLLYAALKLDSTTTLSTPTRYRHRFANKFGAKSLTMVHQYGDTRFVYPGCRVTNISFSFSKDQDSVLMASVSVLALDQIIYELALVPTMDTLLGISTASNDSEDPYSAAIGYALINNAECPMKSINFGIAPNLGRQNVFNGKRGIKKSFEGLREVTASAVLDYEGDNTYIKQDMGITTAPTGAYALGDEIATGPVALTFTPANNGDGFSNILGFYLPQAAVSANEPVDGPGEIPENLTFLPIDAIGEASATDLYIEVTNGMQATDITTPAGAVVAMPASAAHKYEYGVVTGVPSATVFAAGGATHLSSVDDFYNSRTMNFLTGALSAVAAKTISDYTGATLTFTTATWGSAPAVGDIFEIV